MEDNIHLSIPDKSFQNSLREIQSQNVIQNQSEPGFFQEDMDKWMNKKFAGSVKEWSLQKARAEKIGTQFLEGTAN